MMKPGKIVATIAMLTAFAASPAAAEELAGGEGSLHVVEISDEACAALTAYVPNGEADYKPGVAADGSKVAPADLDGGYSYTPKSVYSFPVKVAPFAATDSRYSPDTSIEVATVTIDTKTGRVTIDGEDIAGADRVLADACAHHSGKSGN